MGLVSYSHVFLLGGLLFTKEITYKGVSTNDAVFSTCTFGDVRKGARCSRIRAREEVSSKTKNPSIRERL